MKRTALIFAVAAMCLSGCTTLSGLTTAQKVDWACATALEVSKGATNEAQIVHDIAVANGKSPDDADRLAARAATGADVVALVCPIVTVLVNKGS